MWKDELVSDRFGKIGSIPQLEETNILQQVESMVAYIRRRSPDKVNFNIMHSGDTDITAMINAPFRLGNGKSPQNALDAMDGQGSIQIDIKNENTQVVIDVSDTGKRISKKTYPTFSNPASPPKKEDGGLGLSLSKRIIEQYHKGEIFVKHSEPGKGNNLPDHIKEK